MQNFKKEENTIYGKKYKVIINVQDIIFNDIKNKYLKIEITNKNYILNLISKVKYVNIDTNEILYAKLSPNSLTTYEIGVDVGLNLSKNCFGSKDNVYRKLNNHLKQTYQKNEKLFLYDIKLI